MSGADEWWCRALQLGICHIYSRPNRTQMSCLLAVLLYTPEVAVAISGYWAPPRVRVVHNRQACASATNGKDFLPAKRENISVVRYVLPRKASVCLYIDRNSRKASSAYLLPEVVAYSPKKPQITQRQCPAEYTDEMLLRAERFLQPKEKNRGWDIFSFGGESS